MDSRNRLIIVVTGANGGVGFGVCHRLLVQLSQPNPPDAQPRFNAKVDGRCEPFAAHARVTIIMACRDRKRAESARSELFSLLDAHIASLPAKGKEYEYAQEFRKNVRLEIHRLDLGEIRSVLEFEKEVSQKYPYISHLICNAGVATYSHLDFLIFFRQCFESPLKAVLHPEFNVQQSGIMSNDNLGYVWQCNVFGHYVLCRCLQPLLAKYRPGPARVLWMSSVDALPTYDPPTDWQLMRTDKSYQASKTQIDLMVMEFARRAEEGEVDEEERAVRHLLVSPGITPTKNAAVLLKPYILEVLMIMFFYFCRCIGSPHILFSTYKASIAATHIALVPHTHIPSTAPRASPRSPRPFPDAKHAPAHAFPKFSASSDWWGNEDVGIEPTEPLPEFPDEGRRLVERCEKLYQTFLQAEKAHEAGKQNGANGVNRVNGYS